MMGTTANIRWAERGEMERVWVCNPGHPIAEGLGEYFEIEIFNSFAISIFLTSRGCGLNINFNSK